MKEDVFPNFASICEYGGDGLDESNNQVNNLMLADLWTVVHAYVLTAVQ